MTKQEAVKIEDLDDNNCVEFVWQTFDEDPFEFTGHFNKHADKINIIRAVAYEILHRADPIIEEQQKLLGAQTLALAAIAIDWAKQRKKKDVEQT